MLLFVQLLANHMVILFLRYALISPISSQSYGCIVAMRAILLLVPFLAKYIVKLFLCYAIIRPISSQS